MAKTFIPTLLAILHRLCTYIIRYQRQLAVYMSPEQEDLLNAVLDACEDLVNSLTPAG